MTKNTKEKILFLITAIFISGNLYLIHSKEGEQLEKTSFVADWGTVFQQDLYQTIETAGVLQPEEETYAYFEESKGTFLEFFVEEGDSVNQDEPLYSYQVNNYQAAERQLQQEIDRLNGEIAAIEEALAQITAYEVIDPSNPVAPENELFPRETSEEPENNQTSAETVIENNNQTNYLKQQYIIDKEKELAQKQSALESAETQLSNLTAAGDIVTVNAPANGVVTEISSSLKNPIATIADHNLIAKGTLTEQERKLVEKDMEVSVVAAGTSNKLTGHINKLATFPEETQIDQDSHYPFHVTFEETPKTFLPGYHANLSIITEQALDVPVVYTNQLSGITDPSVWVMGQNGKIEQRQVQIGITMGELVEVNGVISGEWIVETPQTRIKEGTVYVTSINQDLIPWKETLTFKSETIKLPSFLQGLVLR